MKVLVFHRRADEYQHLIRERIPELEVAAGNEREAFFKQIVDTDVLIAYHFPVEALKRMTFLGP